MKHDNCSYFQQPPPPPPPPRTLPLHWGVLGSGCLTPETVNLTLGIIGVRYVTAALSVLIYT